MKHLITSTLLVVSVASMAAVPQEFTKALRPIDKSKAVQHVAPAVASSFEIIPLQSPRKSSLQTQIEVMDESFDAVPNGQIVDGKYADCLASLFQEPGFYVNPSYTPESGTWAGSNVYAGQNGTVILQAFNPTDGAYIYSPLGDYSGDITVTMRVRVPRNVKDNYEDTAGANVAVSLRKGGFDNGTSANYDGQKDKNIYGRDCWHIMTFTFHNESADNDGYILIDTPQSLEIDWVKVVDNCTYLAAPHILPITDVTETSFTINWEHVRRAGNYYIDLWERRENAEAAVNVTYDFEDGQLPEGAECTEYEILDGKGNNGTKGVYVNDNAVFTTPNLGVKLESAYIGMRFELNNSDTFNNWGAYIYVEGLTDEGWSEIGYQMASSFETGNSSMIALILDEDFDPDFAGKYYAFRLTVMGIGEGNYLCIDDIYMKSATAYDYVRVYGPRGDNSYLEEDNGWNIYDYTAYTSYTFEELKPEAEYFFRVRNHDYMEFSASQRIHAAVIAAPEVYEASNISASGFTANWEFVTKAEKYEVAVLTAKEAEADEEGYSIFLEEFSKSTGTSDFTALDGLWNFDECSLDEYTDNAGWTGAYDFVGEGMIGSSDYMGGYLISPAIYADPNKPCDLYIDAQGFEGDYLYVQFLNSGNYTVIPYDSNNSISTVISLESLAEGERIRFSSSMNYSFGLSSFEVAQDVTKGQYIYSYYDSAVLDPETTNYEVAANSTDSIYAYSVKAAYNIDKKTTIHSLSSKRVVVDLKNNSSVITGISEISTSDVRELGRYSIQGTQVGEN